MSNEEINKSEIFFGIKDYVDLLIPQNDDASFTENPSVDIMDVAKKVGITEVLRVQSEKVSGPHAHLDGSKIFLNNHDSPEKQRFSIAHEIFHSCMKRTEEDNLIRAVARQGEAWKKKNAGSVEALEEIIADYFAANLLIPTERFILWEDKTDDEIARAFGVEPKCIKKRREEIALELEQLLPKNLSSDVKIEELTPLSLDALKDVMEGHSIHDGGRS